MATSTEPTSPAVLQGTPVVPGVAFGPALLVRGEISPEAVERFGTGQFADAEAALAAYDDAAGAVADGFSRKADKASGAAAEVLTASAGLARDKGLRGAVRKQLNAGEHLVASVAAAVDQFVGIFTQMGGLMAERATDLRDIERRIVAHVVGEPEPGVQMPDTPCVLVAEDLAPSAPRCSSTARPARCRPASRSQWPRRSSPRTRSSGPPRPRGSDLGGLRTARR
jgi:phosphotransferase system enzyme I (PtsI)